MYEMVKLIDPRLQTFWVFSAVYCAGTGQRLGARTLAVYSYSVHRYNRKAVTTLTYWLLQLTTGATANSEGIDGTASVCTRTGTLKLWVELANTRNCSYISLREEKAGIVSVPLPSTVDAKEAAPPMRGSPGVFVCTRCVCMNVQRACSTPTRNGCFAAHHAGCCSRASSSSCP